MSVIHTDCLTGLRMFPTAFFDSVVCDPPYGLKFMGRKWDYEVPTVEEWSEVLRVLKPGGHMVAFGGTRTYHRLVVGIEDAGFEIRDQIGWVFGSGFPKSHNGEWGGTALKPAWEPICMARKPLEGTVEANWREHGTGALAIDACRVETSDDLNGGAYSGGAKDLSMATSYATGVNAGDFVQPAGRWPANVIHDGSDEVLAAFPSAPGQMADVYGPMKRGHEPSADSTNEGAVGFKMKPGARRLDAGSAARFFYCAKASRKDRSEGLSDRAAVKVSDGRTVAADNAYQRGDTERLNSHPTVKPTDLMRYLCRLITPTGGTVLDPWSGSGSTGKAAVLEGFGFIGFEREAEYVEIANARIAHARGQK